MWQLEYPKPVELEWSLGDATLTIDDSQTDLGADSDQVRQVKLSFLPKLTAFARVGKM